LDDNNKKIDDLNEENRRLNYRIKHLVRGMQEILENKVIGKRFLFFSKKIC